MNIPANIRMVDLKTQYERLRHEIDPAIQAVIDRTEFIGGGAVNDFRAALERYLGTAHVVPCANGTDALQIAFMALGLKPGDEVIVPAFTYVATAEVIALLGLKPVMVDVDESTFNMPAEHIAAAITPRTRAIVPVHLFGQSADMEPIMTLAKAHNLFVVEDNAQAIGAEYTFSDGRKKMAGTIGHIGCTSFFPSKNLGCYGDGGAIMTDDADLAARLRMIANHGQSKQYYHAVVGVNSRLDGIQAAVLGVKLRHLDAFNAARRFTADYYDRAFRDVPGLQTPVRAANSTHVFHQYTLRERSGHRDLLKEHLDKQGVPAMIYYPVPLYEQEAFGGHWPSEGKQLKTTHMLCREVISLPVHSEPDEKVLERIVDSVRSYYSIF